MGSTFQDKKVNEMRSVIGGHYTLILSVFTEVMGMR